MIILESSPDSFNSVTISAPPINSPPTKTCGKVGQSETLGKVARTSELAKMSTYENSASQSIKAFGLS